MQPNWKKILIGLGIVIFAVVSLYLIYIVFFKGEGITPKANVNVNENVNTGQLPPTVNINVNRPVVTNQNVNAVLPTLPLLAQGGDTLASEITGVSSKGSTLASDGTNLIFYDETNGQFYQISADGKTKTLLTDEIFPQVEDINWAPNKDKAILTFPDQSKILYDFNLKTQVTLPKEMEEISFAPSGDKVTFEWMAADPDNRVIGISNPDGTAIQGIESIGDKADDVQTQWSPNNQIIAAYRESISAENQEIFFIGLHGENFKSLEVDGRGFEGQWASQGDKMLYSVYNSSSNYNPTLWITDAQGENIGRNKQSLGIQTWSSKCTFASDTSSIYCAVPNSLQEGSGLYPEIADQVSDSFYQIDLTTGAKTLLANPKSEARGSFNVDSVFLSENEKYLYFRDRDSGRLHSLQIKN